MTQARDLADGKFDTDTLVVDAANNRVAIGATSSVARLEIEDGGTSDSYLMKITADDQNPYAFMVGNDTYSSTDSNGFGFVQRNDGAAYIYNGGALRAALHSVSGGVLSVEGGVVLGAGAANSTTANTLNDYEEGTWTPTVSTGYSSVPTYVAQQGTYTKIGRLVTCHCRLEISAGTQAGSAFSITGLPFTVRSTNPNGGGFTTYQNNFHSTDDFYPFADSNSTSIFFHEENGTAVNANELDGTAWEIRMIIIYEQN